MTNDKQVGLHRYRFHVPESKKEKLLKPDPEFMSLIESSVKEMEEKNILQFTTSNCGKNVAQQRLIKYLIQTL
jgi:hypothetical protein